MAGMSIRLRLTVWYSAVLLLGMMVFGCAIWVGLERRMLHDADERLAARIEGVRTVFRVEAPAGIDLLRDEVGEFLKETQDAIQVEIRDAAGAVFLSTLDSRRPRESRSLAGRITYAGTQYDVLVTMPLDDVRGVMRTLRVLLLTFIPAVLLAACAGGYWISRRALAPVDEITRVARSISVRRLSQRLAVPQTGDELQRMSETWNEVLERLEGAVKRIRQFTADASHELRTPLALIRATAELALRRQRPADEYRAALTEIVEETGRMTDLTESLLLLARADAEGIEMPMAPADLNTVVEDVVRQSYALAQAKGVGIRADLGRAPAIASVNEAAVRRLLLVLIDNALKHTPPGGTVSVSSSGTLVSVLDSGEGIDPEILPHIFERFYRGDKARSGDGAGLGLSIAQAIAHAHGSEIQVESAPGAGTRFQLRFRSTQAGA